jgi:hypothetical protein
MKVLTTGSRDWPEENIDLIETALLKVILGNNPPNKPPWELVVGDNAKGADRYCREMWSEWGHTVKVFDADWYGPCKRTCTPNHRKKLKNKSYCPAAGPYRNQRMVDEGPDVCLAFPTPGSVGTWDCVRRARSVPG